MAEHSITLSNGRTVGLVTPKLDLNVNSRKPGGKYHVPSKLWPLLQGSLQHGWLGEIPASKLITGSALAAAVGGVAGTAINDTAGWLGFTLEGKYLLVAKKPLRHSASWNHLNSKGLVYGTKTIEINGLTYKVRLLKGSRLSPYTGATNQYDTPETQGSEWNRLMYRVSGNLGRLTTEGISIGDWAQYSDSNLGLATLPTINLCQDLIVGSSSVVSRGVNGITFVRSDSPSAASGSVGWRPVLELVE